MTTAMSPVSMNVTVTTQITITTERIGDLLISAFEGGSNYWIHRMEYVPPEGMTLEDKFTVGSRLDSPKFLPLFDGGKIVLDPGEGEDRVTLDGPAIRRGLSAMSEKYPKHFADFLAEDDDADTADVFVQCCVFGEVQFG